MCNHAKKTVFLIEVKDPNDPICSYKWMYDAINAEMRELLQRGTFKFIIREDILPLVM